MTETLIEARSLETIAFEYRDALEVLARASAARADGERELARQEQHAQWRVSELKYELLCAAVGERPKPWSDRDSSREALR